ncbi:MAG: hypothetical protein Q8N09_06420 [Thermodesulfovibrionia bacterium]|nr:hypothetical protein [Thermodesulfovibrionia bacterium]
MAITEQQLKEHIFRLVYVIRNAANYESLSKYQGTFTQNYWIMIQNNFFDFVILEWCKIFGTDSEPTHWKNLVDDHVSFRAKLLARVKSNETDWKDYWEYMITYRNNLISHHQKDPSVTHHPDFDKGIEASYYYYEYLIKKLRGLGNTQYPDNLKDYYDRHLEQAIRFSETAYNSTKDIKENVY